jgi:hypothetical protein
LLTLTTTWSARPFCSHRLVMDDLEDQPSFVPGMGVITRGPRSCTRWTRAEHDRLMQLVDQFGRRRCAETELGWTDWPSSNLRNALFTTCALASVLQVERHRIRAAWEVSNNWAGICGELRVMPPTYIAFADEAALGRRNAKQCRERWLNHGQGQHFRKGPWLPEEEVRRMGGGRCVLVFGS